MAPTRQSKNPRQKRRIGIRELKNSASRIVEEVRERKTPYVVTRRGKPVAVLRPWTAEDGRAQRETEIRESLESLRRLSQRVGRAAGRKSARAAVSEQRR